MAWGFGVTSGFSGLAGVSTGPGGTGPTMAAPATAAPGGVAQGTTSIGITCAVCQMPVVRQGLFLLAVVLLYVFWHAHIHSLLD